jgi:SAM-dependent methyltransferase
MTQKRTVTVYSDSWQPGFIDQHTSDLSRYLEETSRSDVVRRVADCAFDLMSPLAGKTVLEVGCGNGVLLPRLAEAAGPGGRVVGIDHSEAFVAESKARVDAAGFAARVTVQAADAYHLPFPEGTFDTAHCERVLMHLDEPGAALAEMKRVVRPGGWIVAAEPDWVGLRIDHVDPDGLQLILVRARRSRQPGMGVTLYRRMGELAMIERRAVPIVSAVTNFEVLKGFGLTLAPAADSLVADGTLTRARADALLSYLEEANAADRFYGVAAMHVVAGRVQG